MSRAFRKLRKEKEPGLNEINDIEEEDLVPVARSERQKRQNAFQMAANFLSSSESNNSDEEDEEEEIISAPKDEMKKKKINKKKCTVKKFIKKNNIENEDNGKNVDTNCHLDEHEKEYLGSQEDEVDRSLREVNRILGEVKFTPEPLVSHHKTLLNIQNRLLDPITEMNNLKQRPSQKKFSKGFNSRLVTPKPEWAYYGIPIGISMKQIKNEDGILYFAFEHNQTYYNIQNQFLDLIYSPHATELFGFLNQYPFHVDSLIQCSNISRASNDSEMEMELIWRSLYGLESILHPSFSFSRGDCRLLYSHQMNRCFHISLLHQAVMSFQRGAPRASLELCRLGLVLDPSDPLALVLLLDAPALAAEEPSWLLDYFATVTTSDALLPNVTYSRALAMFLSSRDGANEALQEAIILYPRLLLPLLEEENKFKFESTIRNHNIFNNQSSSGGFEQLKDIYVKRCAAQWRKDDIREWVVKNTKSLLEGKKDCVSLEEKTAIATAAVSRLSHNIRRHLLLARDSAPLQNKPLEEIMQASWDPYPPMGGLQTYVPPALRPPPLPIPSDMSPALAFFYSMLPSFQNT